MAYLAPTKISAGSGIPVFHKSITTVPGGFALNPSGLTTGATFPAGSVVAYDESTRIATNAAADGSDNVTGLTKEDIIVGADTPVTVVVGGIVYERRITAIPAPVKAKLPKTLIFSNSK